MDERRTRVKVLLGPGPSNSDPAVLRALSEPTLGHLDPDFVAIMDETTELLRYVFQTENSLTIPISGKGSAGMETALVNTVETGDKVVICTAGLFGDRMADIAERVGGEVSRVAAPWVNRSTLMMSRRPSMLTQASKSLALCTRRLQQVCSNLSIRSYPLPTTMVSALWLTQ